MNDFEPCVEVPAEHLGVADHSDGLRAAIDGTDDARRVGIDWRRVDVGISPDWDFGIMQHSASDGAQHQLPEPGVAHGGHHD